MVFLSQNYNEVNNEVSALLRVVRTHYQNEIKLNLSNVNIIREFKLKILKKSHGYYKFLFLIKVPKNYPCEPMWAEPVVVCRQMINEFTREDFRSYKLRPLIDNLLNFCQKYEFVNTRNPIIAYPAAKMNEDENIASKVLLLLNKALKKFRNPHSNSIPSRFIRKPLSGIKLKDNVGYYNDMGINAVNYVNMFDKFSRRTKSYYHLKKTRGDLYYGRNFKMRKQIHKGIAELLYVSCMKVNVNRKRETKYCKLSTRRVKKFLSYFLMIPDGMGMMDIPGDITVEIGNNLQVHLKMIYDTLVVRNQLINVYEDYADCEKSPLIVDEVIPFHMRMKYSFNILPFHSRQLISMETYYNSLQYLFHYLTILQQQRVQEITKEDELSLDSEIYMHDPVFLMVEEEEEGYFVDSLDRAEVDCANIIDELCDLLLLRTCHVISSDDCVTKEQVLLSEKSQEQSLCQKGDTKDIKENENSKIDGIYGINLTKTCSDVLAELIRYPTEATHLFEYILDLNPREKRHSIILDCMGLLHYKHISKLEVLASTDYEVSYTFVKEIVESEQNGAIIRLYKLAPGNSIFDIVNSENAYFKSLSKENRSIWCMARSTDYNLQLFGSVYNFLRMYRSQMRRRKLMNDEASKLKCSNLRICRCHFYKEFVESLSIFNKSI